MTEGPSVRRIKREKRDLRVEPAPGGMSRRRFLTFLGTGSTALAAGSAGVLTGCARSEEQGSTKQGSRQGKSAPAGRPDPFRRATTGSTASPRLPLATEQPAGFDPADDRLGTA